MTDILVALKSGSGDTGEYESGSVAQLCDGGAQRDGAGAAAAGVLPRRHGGAGG